MTIREQSLPGYDTFGAYYNPDGSIRAGGNNLVSHSGHQITESEGHPFRKNPGRGQWDGIGKNSEQRLTDLGGPFYTEKCEIVGQHAWLNHKFVAENIGPLRYEGTYGVQPEYHPGFSWEDPFPPSIASSVDSLREDGATAISRVEPTKSVADLDTALGELMKDGIPNLPLVHSFEKRAKIAVDAGGEFLNGVFGWLPLVNDITDTALAMRNADKIMRQYERDSGRAVRRRYSFPVENDTQIDGPHPAGLLVAGGLMTNLFDDATYCEIIRKRTTYRKKWFSGSFTYYLPSDYKSRQALGALAVRSKKLLGIDLTPETLYNLAPWSWMVDWFTNAGDVVHNVSAFSRNGLILRYGYMMETTIVTDTYSYRTDAKLIGDPSITFKRTVKQRTPAGPYGFGISYDGLSSFQKSVLVALGISRKR